MLCIIYEFYLLFFFVNVFICSVQIAVEFFNRPGREPLTFSDRLEFVNFWYLVMVLNDVLVVAGCVSKMLIETKVSSRILITKSSLRGS